MPSFVKTVLTVLAVLVPLTSIPAVGAAETIRINGTGSGLAVMKPLIAAFRKENRGISFDMEKSLGSSASIKAVSKNALDLAVSGRAIKPAEAAEGLVAQEYGKIPFAVITHRSVPVVNLTSGELAALYAGTTTRWPGGELVRVVLRPNEDTDTKLTRSIAPEMDQAVSAAHARKDMLLGITDNEAFDCVKKTEGGVAVMGLSLVLAEPDAVRVVKLNGVQPTVANLAAGKYPFKKEMHLVTRKDPPAALKKFVAFVNSRKGRAIAAKNGLLVTGAK